MRTIILHTLYKLLLHIGGTRRSEPTPKELVIQKMSLAGDQDDMRVTDVTFLNLQGKPNSIITYFHF